MSGTSTAAIVDQIIQPRFLVWPRTLRHGSPFDEYIDRKHRLQRIYEALDFLGEGQHHLIDLSESSCGARLGTRVLCKLKLPADRRRVTNQKNVRQRDV